MNATAEVAIRTPQGVSRFEQREVIETIKQTVCRGASDAQLQMFLQVCKATGLDPFLKEIWYVAEKGIIMAGRDGYLRVANENPAFDGIETHVERDEKNVPIKAVCTVWRKDRTHPTVCEAFYSEYKKNSPVWTQYPSAMIGKVAEVLALKRSFSINGVVTEEEIGEPALPQGSREEQQKVLDRKLAEIRKPAEAVEITAEVAPTPSTLDQILATFKGAASITKAYDQMREHFCKLLDPAVFDGILQENGMGEGGARTIGAAKACFRILWATYEKELAAINAISEQEPA